MPKTQLTGKQSDFLKIVVAAAGRGDLEAVRQFLEDRPEWIHTIGSHGRTMLWEAAYRGKLEVVKFLVEQGADINLPGCHLSQHDLEITPYCVARHEGRDEVADYLLEQGAIVDIHTAAYLADYETTLSILDNDPNLVNSGYLQSVMLPSGEPHSFEYRDTEWATPLCYAIVGGNIRIVELLISRGAIIEPHSKLLLDHAVSADQIDIVKLLISNGVDASKAPRIYDDNSEMSVLLKSHGVPSKDINAFDWMGWPPLPYACRGDKGEHPEAVLRLLELGADINVQSSKGKTALHCAAKAGFLKVVNVLIENGANIDATDNNGETPLYDAIRSTIKNREKQRAALEALLIKGANPNVKNRRGLTPLQAAQQMRRADAEKVVALLKKYGAA
ncbi:MAG: ankyrin repeat domain-containing protein [Candidatus Poribacteria bacterium]|nr:ankyrin repeat domain-containing protein [Candidatus Poribacteria bacterium]